MILKTRRSFLVFLHILVCLFMLTRCINTTESGKPAIENAFGEQFAGSAACMQCHKEVYDSHIKTAHYLTSAPAIPPFIKGSFDEGKNNFSFGPNIYMTMEKRDTEYYQVQFANGMEVRRQKFDIVIGSGTKGQSSAYLNGNKLFQMPLFFYAAKNEWANSPGFPGKVIFSRPITSRCLECHSTYAHKISDAFTEPEEFDHNRIIFGVDCEKCHGPAKRHVEYQLQNPDDKNAKFIINPAKLSRAQNLDLCALCHKGRQVKTVPSFTFRAGDTLSNYFIADTSVKEAANIDVHGNQYGLLAASKCFKLSAMTCTTCHNTHRNERGMTKMFSQKCMTCHNEQHENFCKMNAEAGVNITKNCIDCHMPVQPSKAIMFLEQGSTKPATAFMRSHYISIYPDATKKYVDLLKKQ